MAKPVKASIAKANLAQSEEVGTSTDQLQHMLKICRDIAHHNKMHFTVWTLEIAMHSLHDKDQSVAVPLVDRAH